MLRWRSGAGAGSTSGRHVGYGWVAIRSPTSSSAARLLPPGSPCRINSKGSVWGFHAGANWQSSAWVGGLEIDLSGTNIKGSSSVSASFTEAPASVSIGITQTDKSACSGRLAPARVSGVARRAALRHRRPRLDPFVEDRTETISFRETPDAPPGCDSRDREPVGASAPSGVGVEAKLWDSNWLARVEYLHDDISTRAVLQATAASEPRPSDGRMWSAPAGLQVQVQASSVCRPARAAMPVKGPRAAAVVWSWERLLPRQPRRLWMGTQPVQRSGGDNPDSDRDRFQRLCRWLPSRRQLASGAWVGGLEVDLSAPASKGQRRAPEPGAGARTVTVADKFDLLGSAIARLRYLV